ncbi:MAG: hypothetical protein MIO92_01955 [Methanosarcinaceae archaeon]|nr:hypothetical protein [Methanosarcinaceae archaeon]
MKEKDGLFIPSTEVLNGWHFAYSMAVVVLMAIVSTLWIKSDRNSEASAADSRNIRFEFSVSDKEIRKDLASSVEHFTMEQKKMSRDISDINVNLSKLTGFLEGKDVIPRGD